MANTSALVPAASNSEQELAALVSQVAALSKLAVDLTERSVDSNEKLPRVVQAQVEAALAEARPPTPAFFEYDAPTPVELEALFPAGRGDNQAWHVVCVGRKPGLYAASDEADEQVRGVPEQSRRKMAGRATALAYYRNMYEQGKVTCLTEIPPHNTVRAAAFLLLFF
ncbi:hypothetical protein K438DRAFT_1982026 [Mycena galopus ATCC 62051]|nr:hypothetical protein K438DRAFT_1982026 [Mycena galopus ATCC 62051]